MSEKNIYKLKDKFSDNTYNYYMDSKISKMRVTTIYEKEQDTIKWLNNLTKDDILLDIGANMGIYTIYASPKVRKVYAIEPHMANCLSLMKNVELNNYKNITIFSIALHNEELFSDFNMGNLEIGTANNQFTTTIDGDNNKIKTKIIEKKFGTTIDNLIFKYGVMEIPDHIKMDVDGNEFKILMGAEKLLGTQKVKSLIIEYNQKEGKYIIDFMEKFGYVLKERQLTANGKKKVNQGVNIEKLAHNMLFVLQTV